MQSTMVNSGSFGSGDNGHTKIGSTQASNLLIETQSTSPITASSAIQNKNDFMQTADTSLPYKEYAVEPIPSKTELESNIIQEEKKSFFCSVPLEKVQTILSTCTTIVNKITTVATTKVKNPRKILCLYCERTFVNLNLRQKHIERCHSTKQFRRVSLRKHQNFLTSTQCIYCDKFSSTEHTLKELFEHLINCHSNRYFGCIKCEERFLNISYLSDHNAFVHNITENKESVYNNCEEAFETAIDVNNTVAEETTPLKITRSKLKQISSEPIITRNKFHHRKIEQDNDDKKTTSNIKKMRCKKLAVKSSRIIIKRSKRLQAKINENQQKKKRSRDINKKEKTTKQELFNNKLNEKPSKVLTNSVNPYPEFDNYFQVKKITDHSIDNLKIGSLTFDDVFDKAFFNRIKCNIQENLLHHIDGKLFKNEESESRISNFEKISNVSQDIQNVNSENYGCELSLNAVAPTTMFLSSQFGEDLEAQIEYGSKPSKKKAQVKKDEVNYKYFTRRKYQASILEHKENRDLSKLDMWTQYIIKNRQQKVLNDKKSAKEILDYFSGEEYKSIMRREELNRILDRRGPFEDLREEASKKAALEKCTTIEEKLQEDNFNEVKELLNELLNKVFELVKEPTTSSSLLPLPIENYTKKPSNEEIPSYLCLRPKTSNSPNDSEIDKSDKIALICSSQETENFELPSNTVRDKNEKVELTGEWARSRIYVCAACGLKLQNIKQFLEHKSAAHQYVWVQHYEFVGNQSELYRHLSIPVLGKVGVLENLVQCKIWKKSDYRLCTKCSKLCNSLGELHRHILECGGDWTWMLARKKCKYRPFGAKSRRKRRGLVKRIYTQKTEPTEKKLYKKPFDMPRQKPSDADTIQRMLANLPAKRATRKIMCLKDGFNTTRKKQIKTKPTHGKKFGKLLHINNGKEQNKTSNEYKKNNKTNNYRRSLRSLNKVLTSRILDTNSSLIVRRKYKKMQQQQQQQINKAISEDSNPNNKMLESTRTSPRKLGEVKTTKRSSPRIEKQLETATSGKNDINKMSIKRYFPIKKKKTPNLIINEDIKSDNMKIEEIPINKESKNFRSRKRKITTNHSSVGKPKVRKKTEITTITKTKRSVRNNKKIDAKLEQSINETIESVATAQYEPDPFLGLAEIPNESPPEIVEEIKENTPDLVKIEVEMDVKEFVMPVLNVEPPVKVELPKKRIRKPTRGLNDCIAMLTSKLNKSLDDVKDIEKSGYILKIPSFIKHFDKPFESEKSIETESNLNNDNDAKTEVGIEEKEEIKSNTPILENNEICPSLETDLKTEQTTVLQDQIESEEVVSQNLCEHSDSDDEIPLSAFITDDSSELDAMLGFNDSKIEESTFFYNLQRSQDEDEPLLNDIPKETFNPPNIPQSVEIDNNCIVLEKSIIADKIETTLENMKIKHKSKKKLNDNKVDCEIKENEIIDEEFPKRKRKKAKTKPLKSLLDDALIELTESERNRDTADVLLLNKQIRRKNEDSEEIDNVNEEKIEIGKELRRSRRNSKKITSYNEIDFIDPVFEDITIYKSTNFNDDDNLVVKRNNRKKIHKEETKLNGEELFDLLKDTTNENITLPKATSSFLNHFDEISNDFNDVLDNILEKSIAVIEEDLAKRIPPETVEIVEQNDTSNSSTNNNNKSKKKCKSKTNKINSEQISNNKNLEGSAEIDVNTKPIYCEICNKTFSRVENLSKHKRTLTHISKLSELEAKEAESKRSKLNEDEEEAEVVQEKKASIETPEKADSIETPEKEDLVENHEKEDSIETPEKDDSIDNPEKEDDSLKLANLISDVLSKPVETTDNFTDSYRLSPKNDSLTNEKSVDYFESEISNTAGIILEKQISLLENIIVNRSGLNYIDDLSNSSSPSIRNDNDNNIMEKVEEDNQLKQNLDEESFLKPTQYEEISEDSNLRNYDDQNKSRKVLNRDEELFLECCSLLKSGSEVSNYSKKSKDLRQRDESDWLENNYISHKENRELLECYLDNSRIATPLGDNFAQDESNSDTISSQWHTTFNLEQDRVLFEPEVEHHKNKKRNCDNKKMLTKGAMKVFEGLKVSIPTEDLNISTILNRPELEQELEKKLPPIKNKRKSTSRKKQNNFSLNSKISDIYDFEETQDNSDVFSKPDFRSFRSNYEKVKQCERQTDTDNDSQEDGLSSSASSISELLPKKAKTQQNITKKKCMIMGRIFKNAVKSRSIDDDEDIRNIPIIDNTKLVEDFVLSCPEPICEEKRPNMTEEELNLAFDQLVNGNNPQDTTCDSKLKSDTKTCLNKRKSKLKNRKRSYGHSDSTDDEFKVEKIPRRRSKNKSDKNEESCINLEQELKECIGVASRKSQRKCTSGKQNILTEYWSSDESTFGGVITESVPEIIVEDRIIEEKQMPLQQPIKKQKSENSSSNRRKRAAVNPLYHWSSSSEDESRDLIEIKPLRDEIEDDEERPIQHGWIVGDSPKKLVTMLAQAKGKKCDFDGVKEHGKKRTNTFS